MRLVLILLFGLFALASPPARAEEAPSAFTPAQRAEIIRIIRQALTSDPTILRDAIATLQEDEARDRDAAASAAIRQFAPALFAAADDPVGGNPHGDVTVVEFYDLRCPYCRRMVPVMAELTRRDPNIRIVYKDIPILGEASVLGARAVLAAQRQDGYARLQAILMHGSPQITTDSLRTAAAEAGLDWPRLQHDMQDPAIEARIRANLDLARKLGVDGTPAFVIGKRLVPGAVDLAALQDAVQAARAR